MKLMSKMSKRLELEHELSYATLIANGWKQDEELHWWRDGYQLDYVSNIFWARKDYGIHGVDSVKRLNECMGNIDSIEVLNQISNNYKTEF